MIEICLNLLIIQYVAGEPEFAISLKCQALGRFHVLYRYVVNYSEGEGPYATPTQLIAPGYRYIVETVDTVSV